MDMKPIQKKLTEFIKKYKFVALILLAGIVLMLIPGKQKTDTNVKSENQSTVCQETDIRNDLEALLSQISGAGRVEVMLTTKEGEEVVYQTDESNNSDSENINKKTDTVTVTDQNRNQTGMVRKVNPPVYRGAVVVCEGADDPNVRLAIVDAVSKITGLATNHICVLKMK